MSRSIFHAVLWERRGHNVLLFKMARKIPIWHIRNQPQLFGFACKMTKLYVRMNSFSEKSIWYYKIQYFNMLCSLS